LDLPTISLGRKMENGEWTLLVQDQCTRVGVEWFLCEPKMANCEKDSMKKMLW
jgi:hypothetical protein